jgi:Fe-S-cluster containining protein
VTRQQRRQQQRERSKQADTVLKDGMPPMPSRAMLVGLADRLFSRLIDKNSPKNGPQQAARVAEIVHQVFEASLAQTPAKLDTACRKGCGYCCHAWVAATAPEVFLIARHLQSRADSKQSDSSADWLAPDTVTARASVNVGLDIAARFGAKLPCVFLADNACSIYAVRPTVCRQVSSTNLTTCVEEFEGQGLGEDITVSKTFLDHARNCRLPLLAALQAAGLPGQAYELSAAITRALETPKAEARWLAGEDIFVGIATAPADAPALKQAISIIASDITL